MKKFSRMTLANIRTNGFKAILALLLVGGPLLTFSVVDTAPVSFAGGGHIDDVDPG